MDVVIAPDGRRQWSIPIFKTTDVVNGLEIMWVDDLVEYCSIERIGTKSFTHHVCSQHDVIIFWQRNDG